MLRFICIAFTLIATVWTVSGSIPGGLSSEETPGNGNDNLQTQIIPQLSSEIRSQVLSKLISSSGNSNDTSLTEEIQSAPIQVLSYKTQVVAGRNYFVKAKIGDKYIFHLRIYEHFNGNVELSGVKGPLQETDPIEYF